MLDEQSTWPENRCLEVELPWSFMTINEIKTLIRWIQQSKKGIWEPLSVFRHLYSPSLQCTLDYPSNLSHEWDESTSFVWSSEMNNVKFKPLPALRASPLQMMQNMWKYEPQSCLLPVSHRNTLQKHILVYWLVVVGNTTAIFSLFSLFMQWNTSLSHKNTTGTRLTEKRQVRQPC